MRIKIQKIILIALLLCLVHGINAQNHSKFENRFLAYYLNGDMNSWRTFVDSLRTMKLTDDENLSLLIAEYGLIGNYLGQNLDDEAEEQLALFKKHLNKTQTNNPNSATLHALQAAATAFTIGLHFWKAPFLSSSNFKSVELAMTNRVDEVLPLIEIANSLYFRPIFVGGNKKLAIQYYQQAYDLLKKEYSSNWLYYYIGAWLGQIYLKQDEIKKAEFIYLELLQKEPNFDWVKNELLPQLYQGKKIYYRNLED